MKVLFLFFILTVQLNAYAQVCSDIMWSGFAKTYHCRFIRIESDCAQHISNVPKLSDLSDTIWMLSLSNIRQKLDPEIQRMKNSYLEIDEIRNKNIRVFLRQNKDLIDRSFYMVPDKHVMFFGQEKRFMYSTKTAEKFFKFIDKNYQEYFLRYVPYLRREMPWDQIEKLEKGLSFEQALDALAEINTNGCTNLLRRYKLMITIEDLGRAVLDHHFRSLI
jgi:hypothetical protein